MRHRIDCAVVGDAMIDILLPLSGIGDVHSLAQGGVVNTKMELSPGGSANIAFYITKLGGTSVFMGRVGDDYFGQVFLQDLEKNGILANVSISKTENTGVVFVLVFRDGERFFIDDRGANARLVYEDLNLSSIVASKYLFLSGYSFQNKGILAIRKLLKKIDGQTSIVFNPGAPNLSKKYRRSFVSIIDEYVSVLVMNEAEAKYLTGYGSERKMLNSLLSIADTVAITRGDRGSVVARQDEVYQIKASPVQVVDTTGAGDAYAGGFIYGLCQGWDARRAGEFASKVASTVVGQFGARVDISGLHL